MITVYCQEEFISVTDDISALSFMSMRVGRKLLASLNTKNAPQFLFVVLIITFSKFVLCKTLLA